MNKIKVQALKVIEIQCCILLMALLHFCFIIIKQWFSYSVHWLFDQIFFFPFSNKFEDDTCRVYFHNHFISSFSSFSFFALLSYSLSRSLSFYLPFFISLYLSCLADQLNSIRSTTTLARFICKTTRIKSLQSNVFFFESPSNPKVSCKSQPEINYNLWRERD